MKTFSAEGIVLKRVNTGEQDRVVTIFTREMGKLVCIAKGSRKLTSSKLAALEPGCLIKAHFVNTHSLPILTQARLVDDFSSLKVDLISIRNLFQILEMLDAVLVESDEQPEVFRIVLMLLSRVTLLDANKTLEVRAAFTRILSILGFATGEEKLNSSLSDAIESLTAHRLKAFAYLSSP